MNKKIITIIAALFTLAVTSFAHADPPSGGDTSGDAANPATPGPTCDDALRKQCQDAGCCSDAGSGDKKDEPKGRQWKYECTDGAVSNGPYSCTCSDERNKLVQYQDFLRGVLRVSCVPSAEWQQKQDAAIEALQLQMKLLGDDQAKLRTEIMTEIGRLRQLVLDEIQPIKERLDGHDRDITGIRDELDGDIKPRLAALEETTKDHEERLDDIEGTGVQFGLSGGAMGFSRGDNGAAGVGLIGATLNGWIAPWAGICAHALLGAGSAVTLDDTYMTVDIAAMACFRTDINEDVDIRVGLGPYVAPQFRPVVNRDEGEGMGNDIGYSVGAELELGIGVLDSVLEFVPFGMVGSGVNEGINPDTQGLIVSDGVQGGGGLRIVIQTPTL